MEELIKMIVDNGVAVACVGYFMWLNATHLKRNNELLTKISTYIEKLASGGEN